MKLTAKGSSKYLAKEDVPNVVTATIADVKIVQLENPTEKKPLLFFAANQLKAMILNVTNRRILIGAYGDETDAWAGRTVEIFVDPNVPNSRGEIVGGLRLRIPAAKRIGVKPIQAPPRKAEPTVDEDFATGLAALDVARTAERLDEWAIWLGKLDLSEDQHIAAQHRYERNMARITAPASAARPAIPRSKTASDHMAVT